MARKKKQRYYWCIECGQITMVSFFEGGWIKEKWDGCVVSITQEIEYHLCSHCVQVEKINQEVKKWRTL